MLALQELIFFKEQTKSSRIELINMVRVRTEKQISEVRKK